MTAQRASFRPADVRRAIKALEDVGKAVAGVDFPPEGGFRVLVGEPSPLARPMGERNEWDEVLSPK